MAKFLKSIFHPSDTRRAISYDGSNSAEEERAGDVTPSMDVRRKLSISRSGRMKQAQKKRLSLSLDIYGGEIDLDVASEKPKAKPVEYHVSALNQSRENPLAMPNQRRRSRDSMSSADSGKVILRGQGNQVTVVPKVTESTEATTPEEAIVDDAFQIIDKS